MITRHHPAECGWPFQIQAWNSRHRRIESAPIPDCCEHPGHRDEAAPAAERPQPRLRCFRHAAIRSPRVSCASGKSGCSATAFFNSAMAASSFFSSSSTRPRVIMRLWILRARLAPLWLEARRPWPVHVVASERFPDASLRRKIIRLELAAPQKTAPQLHQFSRICSNNVPKSSCRSGRCGSRAMAVCNSLMPPGRSPRKLFILPKVRCASESLGSSRTASCASDSASAKSRWLDNALARFTCACTNAA